MELQKKEQKIFDPLRRRYVALTPEEQVRQYFVAWLVNERGYPRELLANEVSLTIGNKHMRADTVLYDNRLRARMIIEYKAPSVALTRKVLEQITSYNILLDVDYLVVSNGHKSYCLHREGSTYSFLPDIPRYEELVSTIDE